MFRPYGAVKSILYRLRDMIWNYPDFYSSDNRYRVAFANTYHGFSPYSHFVAAIIFVLILIAAIFLLDVAKISGASQNTLIEAVVIGQTEEGDLRQLNKIDPLVPSTVQIEKDLAELIYEPMYRYEFIQQSDGTFDGGVVNVLASEIIRLKQGSDYQFALKRGVFWHDNKEFSADDVIQTFEVISNLQDGNAYSAALAQFFWEKVDSFTVRVCTKPLDDTEIESCDDEYEKPILSNFLELLSFKIIPAHLSSDINSNNPPGYIPVLFRSPVGTGPFELENVGDERIALEENNLYHAPIESRSIERIIFKFYPTRERAEIALENGDVHSFASNTAENLEEFEEFSQIEAYSSPVLENQFWGLYFNLKKDPNGNFVGPDFLGDERVRQAIASAISREDIISDALQGLGQEALGPIPRNSYYFNNTTDWITSGTRNSVDLLQQAGWTIKTGDKWLTNESGEEMRFSLYFANNFDRERVAKSIKDDLEQIGIDVVIDRREQAGQDISSEASEYWSLAELNNQILAPRQFDVLLYGMNTFIDPDRFELYHSSQSTHPGLNIASYKSVEETVKKRESNSGSGGSLERVAKVDRWLELARGFDPVEDRAARKERYDEVQDILAKEVPVVYLYHPQFMYYVNKKVQDVDLIGVRSMEDRFRNIEEWRI